MPCSVDENGLLLECSGTMGMERILQTSRKRDSRSHIRDQTSEQQHRKLEGVFQRKSSYL